MDLVSHKIFINLSYTYTHLSGLSFFIYSKFIYWPCMNDLENYNITTAEKSKFYILAMN